MLLGNSNCSWKKEGKCVAGTILPTSRSWMKEGKENAPGARAEIPLRTVVTLGGPQWSRNPAAAHQGLHRRAILSPRKKEPLAASPIIHPPVLLLGRRQRKPGVMLSPEERSWGGGGRCF